MTRYDTRTALKLGADIAAGRICPVEVTAYFLDRAKSENPELQAYVRLTEDRAMAEARAARERAKAGLGRSPLDGVPVSWKDLVDTAGIATEAGTEMLAGRVPARDAVALERASRAGMICLGKTSMPDLAYSGLGVNPWCGTPVNPAGSRRAVRVPGGSSAGAAVTVAAGLAPIAIGSDTGGSVRIPAAFCGVTGLKITAGRVPNGGVVPLAPSLDTLGPLTRNVADAAAAMAILANCAAPDLQNTSLRGVRLIYARGHDEQVTQPGVRAATDVVIAELRAAGAVVIEREVAQLADAEKALQKWGNPITAEGWATWGTEISKAPDKVYPPIRDRLAGGADIGSADILAFQQEMQRLQAAYLADTADAAAVLMPTSPIIAPRLADMVQDQTAHNQAAVLSSFNTRLGNNLGLCGLSIPSGLSDNLPVGLMILCPPEQEGLLLRIGQAVEEILN